MSNIQLAVNGATGRMGSRILTLAHEGGDFEIVAALERRNHPHLSQNIGPLIGLPSLSVPLTDSLQVSADVLIDFSTPESTSSRLEECRSRGTAMVIGTTGFSPAALEAIEAAARDIAILLEPNMSAGVHLLIQIAEQVARSLGNSYDVEIIEAHHTQKVDAPSGTAIKILDRVAAALDRNPEDSARHGRHGQVGQRTVDEIGVHSIRAGDLVGEHTVLFAGAGERIELVHRASSRDTFASGALRAARYVSSQPAGRYGIEDVLGLSDKK